MQIDPHSTWWSSVCNKSIRRSVPARDSCSFARLMSIAARRSAGARTPAFVGSCPFARRDSESMAGPDCHRALGRFGQHRRPAFLRTARTGAVPGVRKRSSRTRAGGAGVPGASWRARIRSRRPNRFSVREGGDFVLRLLARRPSDHRYDQRDREPAPPGQDGDSRLGPKPRDEAAITQIWLYRQNVNREWKLPPKGWHAAGMGNSIRFGRRASMATAETIGNGSHTETRTLLSIGASAMRAER